MVGPTPLTPTIPDLVNTPRRTPNQTDFLGSDGNPYCSNAIDFDAMVNEIRERNELEIKYIYPEDTLYTFLEKTNWNFQSISSLNIIWIDCFWNCFYFFPLSAL